METYLVRRAIGKGHYQVLEIDPAGVVSAAWPVDGPETPRTAGPIATPKTLPADLAPSYKAAVKGRPGEIDPFNFDLPIPVVEAPVIEAVPEPDRYYRMATATPNGFAGRCRCCGGQVGRYAGWLALLEGPTRWSRREKVTLCETCAASITFTPEPTSIGSRRPARPNHDDPFSVMESEHIRGLAADDDLG